MKKFDTYINESNIISIEEKLSFGDKIDKIICKIMGYEFVTQDEYIKRLKKVVEECSDNKCSIIVKKYSQVKDSLNDCLNKNEELSSAYWGKFSIEKGIKEAHWWNDIELSDNVPFVCYYSRENKDKYVLEPESLWFIKEKTKKGTREVMKGLMSLDTENPSTLGWMIKNIRVPQTLNYEQWEADKKKKDEEKKKQEQESIKASIERMEKELVQLKKLVKENK